MRYIGRAFENNRFAFTNGINLSYLNDSRRIKIGSIFIMKFYRNNQCNCFDACALYGALKAKTRQY